MTRRKLRTGTTSNDTFIAGREAEIFRGLDGTDTVSYANSWAGVIVDIRGKTPGDGGAAEGDVYESIENFIGSRHRDVLFGSAGDNMLSGLAGHDRLNGFAGKDTLFGGDGNDQLRGGDDADVLHGERGNDLVEGGAGTDVLHGGAGRDTLFGGFGDDTIYSGSGNDWMEGDGPEAYANAGAGLADVFHFNLAASLGSDSITDLDSEEVLVFQNVDSGVAKEFELVAVYIEGVNYGIRINFYNAKSEGVGSVFVNGFQLTEPSGIARQSLTTFADDTFSALINSRITSPAGNDDF